MQRATRGQQMVGSIRMGTGQLQYAEVTITAAQIAATGAGNFGHASGIEIVPAPGAGQVLDLVVAILIYDYATAAYGAGGNVTVNWGSGGAALTGLVSNANSIAAAGDKLLGFYPLTTAAVPLLTNTGLNLVSSAAFTQPGTAAGVIRMKTWYRVHITGL